MADSDNSLSTTAQNIAQGIYFVGQQIGKVFPLLTGTSTTATGGAVTPPAQVVGYITIDLPGGGTGKVPYYGS